jgi:hypothetical protein
MNTQKLIVIVMFFFINSPLSLPQELNTVLMESTFKIVGPSKVDSLMSTGTVFLIGRPIKDNPDQLRIIMVTAAHVLDSIVGETATLILRKKLDNSTYERIPFEITIRNGTKPLWTRHQNPSVDVAALKISVPRGINLVLLSIDRLANDSIVQKYEIHPGDELFCLGFPFGIEANYAGFPILRSGKIASYPLVPAKVMGAFLFDMNIYEGNSGGPVYCSYKGRIYGNVYHIDEQVDFVMGLISQQGFSSPSQDTPLQLAVVVPAQFIAETISSLP